jgi:peptide deformylase
MRYSVLTYGHAELRRKTQPVAAITEDIRRLARDMLETMYASNGLGLAAQQIGRTESLCVIDLTGVRREGSNPIDWADVPMPLVMLNPAVAQSSGEQTGQEGCLSFPEIFVTIKRAAEVIVVFLNLSGQKETVVARGLLARAVLHELDHLHGVLLSDRMSAVQKVSLAARLKRLRKQGQEQRG